MADSYYKEAMVWTDRYQNKMDEKGHEFVNKFDKKFLAGNTSKIFLEDANNSIEDFFKKTTNVLEKILYTASLHKKNSYSKSDA